MRNKYAGTCADCRSRVAKGAGTVEKTGGRWILKCDGCTSPDAARSLISVRTHSGWTGTRNAHGRCEDAPCCGCCTF